MALGVEAHAAAAALEEPCVEMLLQAADALGDGGGGDAELVCGVGEALVTGGGLEEAQVLERRQGQHGDYPEESIGQT